MGSLDRARVIRVLAPNPGVYTLEGTNTWIVGRDPSVVIDPGPDDAGHLREVRDQAGPIAAVLVTHEHDDHSAGAARLAREAGGIPVRAYRPPEGGARMHDGEEIVAGGARIRAIHAPGHTPDHVVFWVQGLRALFTGDAVLGRGTSVIDPPEGDLALYMRSLARMQELDPQVIYPGHGPAVFDAGAKLAEYVGHRREREEQIMAAIAEGRASTEEMVAAIYADYPADVHPLAARSVLAHLQKLEAEGRVEKARRDGRYAVSGLRVCERCGRPVRGRLKVCGRCSMELLQEAPAES